MSQLIHGLHPQNPPVHASERYPLSFAFSGWDSLFSRLGLEPESVCRPHAVQVQLAKLHYLAFGKPAPATAPIGRFATSAMLRSENELLGLCGPRFSIRVYLERDGTCAGFVNLRRMGEVVRRLSQTNLPGSGTALAAGGIKWVRGYEVAAGLDLGERMYVADALLVPSDTLRRRFHVLTVDLGREYGEGRPVRGTPFAQPLAGVGGGKCAQVAIFMSSSLLQGMELQRADEQPRVCVHGPGEITAILHGATGTTGVLPLKGLSAREIRRYFIETDRGCMVQCNERWRATFRAEHCLDLFDKVLVGYLRGDVPVILPVDSRYTAHGHGVLQNPNINHAVVLVGFEKALSVMSTALLVNDPSRIPFIESYAEQLWMRSVSPETIEIDNVGRPICVPVPWQVRFSIETLVEMHRWGARTSRAVCPGLIDLAMLLQTHNEFTRGYKAEYEMSPLESGRVFQVGELALSRLDKKGRAFDKLRCMGVFGEDASPAIPQLRTHWDDLIRHFPDHWCYVQYRSIVAEQPPRQLWVWDAQSSCEISAWWCEDETRVNAPALRQQALQHVLAVIERTADGEWRRVWMRRDRAKPVARRPADISAHPDSRGFRLGVAAMTSISAEGYRSAMAALGRGAGPMSRWSEDGRLSLDLFAFMQRDSMLGSAMPPGTLQKHKRGRTHPSAVQVMDDAASNRGLVDAAAKRVLRFCKGRRGAPDPQIRAISTFLPEIAAADDPRRERGIQAAIFCVELAKVLRTTHGHDIRAIEIVCGSRVRGLARDNGEYFAALWDEEHLLDVITDSLVRIVQGAGLCQTDGDHLCPLAVELEPGPLNAMNDVDMLVRLSKRIKHTVAWPFAGCNADLAHLHLSGARPCDLDSGDYRTYVRDRLVHAHLSDHGRGVFGDISIAPQYLPEGQTGAPWLKEWLQWLNGIAHERGRSAAPGVLPFSGIVSLELEAVRSVSMVWESFQTLNDWFPEHDGQPVQQLAPNGK